MTLPDQTLLGQAKEWLRERLYDGDRCPCCNQHVQMYRWNLYSTAARALILFYQEGGTYEFVHSNRLKELGHKGQGDASRLRFWGLVEQEKDLRPDGGKSGYWRVTPKGERFIYGQEQIPKYAWVYDGLVHHFDGPQVTISDALGTRFDYQDVLGRLPGLAAAA